MAANLALALAGLGHRVGLLDADVYGPSIPLMLGLHERPQSTEDKRIIPLERFGIKVAKSVEEAIEGADVVNILRIQLERQRSTLYSSLREYARVYGITSARLKGAKPDVTVMHPGPMNRGVEIAQDVADGEHSVILEQVTNGVAVRMAVLYLLAGHKAPDESAAEHPMPKETKKAHGEPSLHPRR